MADTNAAIEFLRQNATKDESGNFHLKQKDWSTFMAEGGITEEVMKAYHDRESELLNAISEVTVDELFARCEAGLKEGKSVEDLKDEAVTFTARIPDGSIKYETKATKTYPIPNEPGKSVTKYLVGKLTVNQNRKIDSATLTSRQDELAKLLGLE